MRVWLTARAVANPDATYQWQRLPVGGEWTNLSDGGAYLDTKSQVLQVVTTLAMNGDQFRCIATNVVGSTISVVVKLTVQAIPLPEIILQPRNAIWYEGTPAGVSMRTTGETSFQWYRNNQPLPGSSSFFSVDGAAPSDAGEYYVVVSNGAGSVTSERFQITVKPLVAVSSVTGSDYGASYLRVDGSVWSFGQTSAPALPRIDGLMGAALFGDFTAYIRSDRTLWLTSYGDPTKLADDVDKVVAGQGGLFFIKTDGSLWSMGNNQFAQLGDGTMVDRPLPVKIADGVNAVSFTYSFVLFVKTDGTLWGAGSNYYGQLGEGPGSSPTPVQIAADVITAHAGWFGTYFIKTDGSLWAMGANTFGQLGDGTNVSRRTPVRIMNDVIAAEGGYEHSLILQKNGDLWLAGRGYGQFESTDASPHATPLRVAQGVSQMSLGRSASYYVKSDGTLWATGAISGEDRVKPRLIAGPIVRSQPNVYWATPASIPLGTRLSEAQLNATASVSGYFSYSPGMDTLLSAGTQPLTVTFTPSDLLRYTTATAQVSLTVDRSAVQTRFVNISARGYCSTGDRVMIGGFVVSGTEAKRVLVRAVGPTLTSQGIGVGEVLMDPVIQVYRGAPVIASNDNWGENANAAEITSTAARIGAASLSPSDTQSAALLLTLQPGVYSFIATGKSATSGIVLLEVYDADETTTTSAFVNIATRAYSTTGNGVTIGGFVISGAEPKQVLLRAVGPTLNKKGIGQTEVLVDPTIDLYKGAAVLAANDNWGTNDNAAQIMAVAARIGATPLDTSDVASAALLVTLQPGVYSFIARGKTSPSGIVLVEVYDADRVFDHVSWPRWANEVQDFSLITGEGPRGQTGGGDPRGA